MNSYPEEIKDIANKLLEAIEKHYPGLTKKTYNNHGFPDRKGSPAFDRACMCLYFELLKAGAFK